jgi:hypothetical protein
LPSVVDQGFSAQIDQHGMMLIIEPVAENLVTPVSRPGRGIPVPACELFLEDLLGQFVQYVGHSSSVSHSGMR